MKNILLVKILKSIHVTGIINRILKRSKVEKHTRLDIYIYIYIYVILQHYILWYTDVKRGQLESRIIHENDSRNEICEENCKVHMARLQNQRGYVIRT